MWNINEASDEQRETMVTALKSEQKGYADAGDKARAAEVQKSIDLWSKPTKAQLAKAKTAAGDDDADADGGDDG